MSYEAGHFLFNIYWDAVTGVEDDQEIVRRRAVQLRDALTRMGPTFIKAGQVLASRPDIVREDYMNELCVLQVGISYCRGPVSSALLVSIPAQICCIMGSVYSRMME